MTQQRDSKGELRAAFAMREIERAKHSCYAGTGTGTGGVLARVALALIFMYLIVLSYLMLGAIGPVFVSVLSLVAYFVPYLYQAIKGLLARQRIRKEDPKFGQETPQEG